MAYSLGSISASPTACRLRGYGRAGTQNDRLGEAVISSTGTPVPGADTGPCTKFKDCITQFEDRVCVQKGSAVESFLIKTYGNSIPEARLIRHRLYIGSISASPTACPLRGYGCAGNRNDRLSEAVVSSIGTPIFAQWTCHRRCRDGADT